MVEWDGGGFTAKYLFRAHGKWWLRLKLSVYVSDSGERGATSTSLGRWFEVMIVDKTRLWIKIVDNDMKQMRERGFFHLGLYMHRG